MNDRQRITTDLLAGQPLKEFMVWVNRMEDESDRACEITNLAALYTQLAEAILFEAG